MSNLETDVKPLLSKLILLEPATISAADADVLAAWAFKTLVNAAFESHRRASVLIPVEFREQLSKHRSPPTDVSLVAFRVDGLDANVRTRVKDVPIRKQGGRQVDAAVVSTALIGRVALQMVSHREAGTPQPRGRTDFEAAAITLWPPDLRRKRAGKKAIDWPTSAAVTGDAEFAAIADPDDDEVLAWIPSDLP